MLNFLLRHIDVVDVLEWAKTLPTPPEELHCIKAERADAIEKLSAAIALLLDPAPGVALSGVRALVALADSSSGIRRQRAVDALCDYLKIDQPDPAVSAVILQHFTRHLQVKQGDVSDLVPLDDSLPASSLWNDCAFDLEGALFLTDIDFSRCVFRARLDLEDATFTAGTNFSHAFFQGGADFEDAAFGEAARFTSSRFGGPADFEGAQFGKTADFKNCRFFSAVDFEDARFGGAVRFTDTRFSGLADFEDASFQGSADFTGTQFGEPLIQKLFRLDNPDFDGARFEGPLSLEGSNAGSDVAAVR